MSDLDQLKALNELGGNITDSQLNISKYGDGLQGNDYYNIDCPEYSLMIAENLFYDEALFFTAAANARPALKRLERRIEALEAALRSMDSFVDSTLWPQNGTVKAMAQFASRSLDIALKEVDDER